MGRGVARYPLIGLQKSIYYIFVFFANLNMVAPRAVLRT